MIIDHMIIRINRSPEMLPAGARQLGTEAWSWHGDGFLASNSMSCLQDVCLQDVIQMLNLMIFNETIT